VLHEKVSSLEICEMLRQHIPHLRQLLPFPYDQKAFEVFYNNYNSKNNIRLGSWYSACCGLPSIRFSTPDRGKWSFSSPKLSDRILRSPSLRFNVYQGPFSRAQRGKDVKRISYCHLIPTLRMMRIVSPSSQRNSCTFTSRHRVPQIFLRISLHNFLK
jgi:hypothetical protein